jgi:FolB domain-containing protein
MSGTTPSPAVALVTGAAKRIGRTIALDLAAHGWAVAVHHNRSGAEAGDVVAVITKAGGRAVALAANLENPAEVNALVPACAAALGAPTLLVNNAALFLPDEVGGIEPALWDRHQAINLRAPVLLAQSLAAYLPAGATGSVVNIIDQRVWNPTPLFFSYAVAKSGLYAATTMLAQALAPRIRVNAIGPGPTAQSIHQTPEQFAAQQRSMPLGHGANPQDIADAVRFLVSAEAMTGQMIALDGGEHLAWWCLTALGGRLPERVEPSASKESFGTRHVLIDRLEIQTMIGVHAAEKRSAQRVWVTLDLSVTELGPSVNDRLEDVLDYAEVIRKVEAVVLAGHINLVETLAERVAAACLTDPKVDAVRVRIEKPDVVANARAVGVEIERRRG